MVDRLTRITTALAVALVAIVAAVFSYRGRVHGHPRRKPPEATRTTVGQVEPQVGIVATIGAIMAHGLNHGPSRSSQHGTIRTSPSHQAPTVTLSGHGSGFRVLGALLQAMP